MDHGERNDVRIEKEHELTNAASIDGDNTNITPKPTIPMPPSLPNPMQTNNLLSRLQTFLPQLEAANRALETEAEGADANTSGPTNQIDVDLCRQSEDESTSSSDDDDDSDSDDNYSCQADEKGSKMSNPKQKSELLTAIATTSKRKRPAEDKISNKSKRVEETKADVDIAKRTTDVNNCAMQAPIEANAMNKKMGDSQNDEDDNALANGRHQQQQDDDQEQQAIIQIQFVMGSHLEEQHPTAMALLTNNDDHNDNTSHQDDDNETDDDESKLAAVDTDTQPKSDRLRVVDQLLMNQNSASSEDSETQSRNKNTPNAPSKSLITELN